MPALAVTKMHGTLNDFIVLDRRVQTFGGELSAFARRWCDRRGGIGADGVLVIQESTVAGARMRVINSDGSEAEMCGNGVRCVARYLYDKGEGAQQRIETLGGIIESDVIQSDPVLVRVNVGTPRFTGDRTDIEDSLFVWVGNPHAVFFVENVDAVDLPGIGARNPDVNVHAVRVDGTFQLSVRHHERGAGLTHACGTGSVAAAAAAIARGFAQSPVTVRVPGGTLTVEWDGSGNAFLTGPAVRVFDATIDP